MADVELNSIGNGDGTNYLVRDNTKIPLSGSNQISGDLVPATTDSVNLGSSAKEYLNAYIKSLTINGVACGNILTHNASEFVPRSGGAVMTGDFLARTVNDRYLQLLGGTGWGKGATIFLYGKDDSSYASTRAGAVQIRADNGSDAKEMLLYPDGTLTLGSKNVAMQEDTVPRSGGAVMSGSTLSRTINNNEFRLDGGTTWNDGASLSLSGKNRFDSFSGAAVLHMSNGSQEKQMTLFPNGTFTWEGTACQLISDQRLKQQIAEIDDKLLDAWEDVNLVQFKYNDAVDQKGDNARLHTGYVVQQIDKACNEHGVDISEYGLYCHEEYPEETEEVEVEQADGTKTKETKVIREANEHYSLRYTEALIVECAYLRKKNKDLQEQLNALSERLEKLENR